MFIGSQMYFDNLFYKVGMVQHIKYRFPNKYLITYSYGHANPKLFLASPTVWLQSCIFSLAHTPFCFKSSLVLSHRSQDFSKGPTRVPVVDFLIMSELFLFNTGPCHLKRFLFITAIQKTKLIIKTIKCINNSQ